MLFRARKQSAECKFGDGVALQTSWRLVSGEGWAWGRVGRRRRRRRLGRWRGRCMVGGVDGWMDGWLCWGLGLGLVGCGEVVAVDGEEGLCFEVCGVLMVVVSRAKGGVWCGEVWCVVMSVARSTGGALRRISA